MNGKRVMSIEFEIFGPFLFRDKDKKTNKFVFTDHNIEHFLETKEIEKFIGRVGVYIFTLKQRKEDKKHAHGVYMPFYIGQTTKNSLGKETFAPGKPAIYQEVVTNNPGQYPCFFFLTAKKRQGRTDEENLGKSIKDLESTLIRIASIKNKEIMNKQEANKAQWSFPVDQNRNFDKIFRL